MRSDTCAFVKIICVEVVAKLATAPDEAVTILAGFVDESAIWQVQLLALTFLGPVAKPSPPVIEKVTMSEQEYVRNAGRYAAAVLMGSYTPATLIFDFQRLMKQMRPGG